MIHFLTEAIGMLVCSVYNMYIVAESWSKVRKYQWCSLMENACIMVCVCGSHHHIWYHSFTCV